MIFENFSRWGIFHRALLVIITVIRFYLSFENALCKDYVTEKTFNALRLNTVRTHVLYLLVGGVYLLTESFNKKGNIKCYFDNCSRCRLFLVEQTTENFYLQAPL